MINRLLNLINRNRSATKISRSWALVWNHFCSTKGAGVKVEGGLQNKGDKVQQEDNMICESVQRGLNSSAYDTGRWTVPVWVWDTKVWVGTPRLWRWQTMHSTRCWPLSSGAKLDCKRESRSCHVLTISHSDRPHIYFQFRLQHFVLN